MKQKEQTDISLLDKSVKKTMNQRYRRNKMTPLKIKIQDYQDKDHADGFQRWSCFWWSTLKVPMKVS